MLAAALSDVSAKADEFSALDALTGDGDHGQAIVSVLNVANATAQIEDDFSTMFNSIGFNIMLETSGSTSTLMGALFLGMSDAVVGAELDALSIKTMFTSALENVRKNTKAQIGDKTMMDVLIPAVEAITACDSEDIRKLFKQGAQAAQKGAEATVSMLAKFGRAKNYGERSIGSADAGASSWATIFHSFYETLNQ